MENSSVPSHIGPFKIIKSLGQGGMGEVFLAWDPTCQREVALKRVRTDLITHEIIKNRFLREALITSQLAHPAIVPIYSIHEEEGILYYIMPYLAGATLKDLIRSKKEGSIASFLRIFMTICQAVAYAHSKGFLHRDLKPENIIVGKYGQVHILDWGLVKAIDDTTIDEETDEIKGSEGLTRPGKLLGTLAYLAPERVLGHPSSIASDIYALGVIFYQILTFHIPFKRKSLKEFKQQLYKEQLISPEIIAPYRDVPPELSRIVKKCLSPQPMHRHLTVDALISDIEDYLEGRSEWFTATTLEIGRKDDWEFQENVLIPGPTEWVSLMVSKESFSGNTQLKAKIKIGSHGAGIGLLLSVPEKEERIQPTDGYCLWLSSHKEIPTTLFRSTVEVMQLPDIVLPKEEFCTICFEKIDQNIHFYLEENKQFSYISHLPLTGTHVGILCRDSDFVLEQMTVSVGSLNLQVSCLAIPDAFLAHKDYAKALLEYRRIASSFPGRQEAREGLFRAGITLLEESKNLDAALEEFEKLRHTPAAPLEYLGKALVYESMHDFEEEAKCFELGIRRYPKHPMLPVLEKEILFRLHNRARQNRASTYRLLLLVITGLPYLAQKKETHALIQAAAKGLELLFFIEESPCPTNFAIQLAFWLNKPHTLAEIFDGLADDETLLKRNILFCLLHQRAHDLCAQRLPPGDILLAPTFETCLALPSEYERMRVLQLLFNDATADLVIKYHPIFYEKIHTPHFRLLLDSFLIRAYLQNKEWQKADEVFHCYPLDLLNQETTILHFLYGCFLYATEGKELASIHFQGILDTPYPKTWSLASHYLFGRGLEPSNWMSNAFPYEKRELYKQLALFYHCQGNEALALHYQSLILSCQFSL